MNRRKALKSLLIYGLLALFLLFALFPSYWSIITSLKSHDEIYSRIPTYFPKEIDFSGYVTLFTETGFLKNLINSFLVAFTVSAASIFVSMLAAYAIARMQFKGRKPVARGVFYAYIMPKTLLFIPVYIIITNLGLSDSIWGLIFIYPTLTIPYATWMLISYFQSIPYEIEEAAIVDGCSRVRAMFKIAFPLSMPGIVSTFIFSFSICWSEYMYALIIINRATQKTISLGLSDMIVGDMVAWGPLMGGAVISTLPIVILYMLCSKYLVGGAVAGGVKA